MEDLIKQSICEKFVLQQKSVFDQTQGQTKGAKNFQGRTILLMLLLKSFVPARIKIFRRTKIFLTGPGIRLFIN